MRNAIYLLLFLSTIFYQCQSQKTAEIDLPPLNQEQFITVLTDIQLMEGWVALKKVNKKMAVDLLPPADYLEEIFSIHNIAPLDFEESFYYYLNQPKVMHDIYQQVEQNVQKMEVKQKVSK